MKKGLLITGIFIAFFFSSCSTLLVEENELTPFDQKIVVSETDKYRADLDAQSDSFITVTRFYDMGSKKVQVVSYFTDNEQIKKMKLTVFGDTDRKYIEYVFLNNDVLLFVSENETFYSSPVNEQSAKQQQSFLNEYYFSDNTLIYWLQQHEKQPKDLYELKKREIFSSLENTLNELSKNPEQSESE